MTETDLKHLIMLELSNRNCKVFNRPTGLFVPYRKPVIINNKKYIELTGRPININPAGHSDLQGHRFDGKCFYLEIKKPNTNLNTDHVNDQERFIEEMKKSGALGAIVDSVEEAILALGV